MAEAPQRYCGNCGHELSLEDQFCSNCGRPVHQTARVPTPEADMPVPPVETLGEPSGRADYGEQEQRSFSTEENKAVSNRVAEAISRGELDALDELMVPDIAREFKEGIAEVRRAFPDYHGTNEIEKGCWSMERELRSRRRTQIALRCSIVRALHTGHSPRQGCRSPALPPPPER